MTSSEDSDSENELDCIGLMVDSDTEKRNSRFLNTNPSTSVDQTNMIDSIAQALVNQEILKQLTKLGDRLDVLEKGGTRKLQIRQKLNLP